MRGILINADERTVTEVDVNPTLENLRKLIGCDYVESVKVSALLRLWIDEEGKLKLPKAGFAVGGVFFDGFQITVAGNGLLLGDDCGKCDDFHCPLDFVENSITWLAPDEVPEPEPPKVVLFDTAEEMIEALRKMRG